MWYKEASFTLVNSSYEQKYGKVKCGGTRALVYYFTSIPGKTWTTRNEIGLRVATYPRTVYKNVFIKQQPQEKSILNRLLTHIHHNEHGGSSQFFHFFP